jgi:pyrroloquinoline quinone biosynthesis protein B
MEFGREAMGTKDLPVYVMPQMKSFLETNGPWSQLVSLKNISLQEIHAEKPVRLNGDIAVIPFTVPHRDEYSETVGFKITASSTHYMFIPDIDKWSKFEKNILKEVESVDVAFLDANFFTSQ